ncbi:MAG: cytochrome c biogenesis protein CcdA [Anaerolineae bacterium]|uniref:cytochrome c biogenesis CcdA family protein n=1 Tax=Promineifilum sp. TaxID=2664178 RepID=UPI001D6CFF02|nr:cytochrome c biogenesis protein CcdA [Anaerolineales bacterium]MCB8934458.1 cytochrome c biogenesis protein CcdA [Promineifilum sp.]MCO5179972.1 cytochrome c biogenesis CcdA family protein [Promineifilum sp.]MCW5847132.1 cytochrome c biogenesis protein CcdA [Anaerolineae bacterium]
MSDLKAPAPSPRKLSTIQLVLIGVGALLVVFLIIGSIIRPDTSEQLVFGVQQQPFAALAVLAFLGGLLSFVSPCTLPILTAYFAFAFQSDRQRIAANTLAFMLGLATTFSLLGATGFALGRVLGQNQGFIMLIGGAAIVIFGVMSLLGRGFTGATGLANQERSPDMRSSYLFGLTFAIGWSACVGPILGVILTLALQTATVWHGMMLLFIYTLGLGLPLLVVSTFFGRMSRQSAFWRVLRGKGWTWDTHVFVVALIWVLALWRIVAAFVEYAIRQVGFLDGLTYTPAIEFGILGLLLIGAVLWTVTGSESRHTTVHLHSTQLISGALFILLGLLMLEGQMGLINGVLVRWSAVIDERTLAFQDWLLTALSR